jgi:hypothetical protein
MAVGFSNEPEKVDETWTVEHRRRTYTFSKTRKGRYHFLYNCSRSYETGSMKGDSQTGVVLDHELTRAEIEKLQRLLEFMNERD